MTNTNPLMTSYNVPPLDALKAEHFVPAIDQAISKAEETFAALKRDTSPATFKNTVVALDEGIADIMRITNMLGMLHAAMGGEDISQAYEAVQQKNSEFAKALYQDQTIAARFQAVADPEAEEDKILYRNLSREFEINGAFLSPQGQERIKEIDNQLIGLCGTFNKNCTEGAKQQAVFFTDPADMEGLPESIVSSLRNNAQEHGYDSGWLIVPERLQVGMLLEMAGSRNFREKIFKALENIGTDEPFDNGPVIQEIQALRHERSTLLGYKHYADYAIAGMMPESLGEVQTLLKKVGDGAMEKFSDTVRKVEAYARAHDGSRKLEPWDLAYWANKYREETFGFDAQKFSEYLPLENAIDGFFKTAERLYGIRFEENSEHPSYHPDVKAYDVFDAETGEQRGIFYADMFARADKYGGAWMTHMQHQTSEHINVVSINMNLMKPQKGQPSLLSLSDLETLFHEGGHAVHGLLGTNTRHTSLQGPSSSSDFVEFFSMVLENWPQQKECLDTFARHYETGEPIPEELLQARLDSGTFLSERNALKLVQNSLRDFAFHTSDPASYASAQDIQEAADLDHPLAEHIGAYPLQRWGHLFSEPLSGYASGYYGYLWSQGLADIGFKPFKESGLFDPESCERLVKIYGYGGSHDQTQAYEEYTGTPLTPDIMANALLEAIGADKPSRLTQSGSGKER